MSRLSFFVLSSLLMLTHSLFAGTNPNREFSVDRTEVFTGVLVTFDASNIKPAKKFIWSLGNGETVTSTHPVLSYQYTRAGTYTASLTYQVNASEKNPNYKSAGSVVITVKDATPKPNIAPTANISCSCKTVPAHLSGLLASFRSELSFQKKC